MDLYEKEMAKPENRRNEARALGYKERAARFYLAASLKARQSKNYLKDPAHREALAEQYETPAQQKAVAIYLGRASDYFENRDVKNAIAYYNRVLKIDRENETAKAELERIKKLIQEAQARVSGRESGGGGDNEPEDETRSGEEWEHEETEHEQHDAEDYEDKYSGKDRWGGKDGAGW
jgi:hypothetical protein